MYWYLPVSWQEFKERLIRWSEQPRHRTIRVQLLLRKKWSESRGKARFDKIRQTSVAYKSIERRLRRRRMRQKHKANKRRSAASQRLHSGTTTTRYGSSSSNNSATATATEAETVKISDRIRDTYRENILGRYRGWKTRFRTRFFTLTEYSKPEWFDEGGRPLTSRDATGRFVNPWQSQSTNGIQSISTILQWRWQRLQRNMTKFGLVRSLIPRLSWTTNWLDQNTNHFNTKQVPPLPTPNDQGAMQLTWIGHSTCWMQWAGHTLLFDPMFSLRAGPFQWFPIGVPRDVAPSHSIAELVQHAGGIIDMVLITHDHYDHLDLETVVELAPHVDTWVVPLGIPDWLVKEGGVDPDRIIELEWWQSIQLLKKNHPNMNIQEEASEGDNNVNVASEDSRRMEQVIVDTTYDNNHDKDNHDKSLKITCCPTQHWASRTMWDRNRRLWCSFAVECDSQRFFFMGDSGYPRFPLFRQIGDALGPFDLAALPIGAYTPRAMMEDAHTNPHQALEVHKDLRAKQSVSVHWGSFALSEEPLEEPPQLLEQSKRKEADPDAVSGFQTIAHGSTIEVEKEEEAEDQEYDEEEESSSSSSSPFAIE